MCPLNLLTYTAKLIQGQIRIRPQNFTDPDPTEPGSGSATLANWLSKFTIVYRFHIHAVCHTKLRMYQLRIFYEYDGVVRAIVLAATFYVSCCYWSHFIGRNFYFLTVWTPSPRCVTSFTNLALKELEH